MSSAKQWRQEGFSELIKGTFGNAGQNIYVSKAGALQRIHHYDVNGDGYPDLIFCNYHDSIECPPTYVYKDVLGDFTCSHLPSAGARSGAVADLNNDGYDDLILGMWFNGVTSENNAVIYYGSQKGWTDQRVQFLPAPHCRSIAVGDFNGDGKLDLAFLSRSVVRIFQQTEIGFEFRRFTDIKIGSTESKEKVRDERFVMPKTPPEKPDQIDAADLDGDGYAELIMRFRSGEVRVYWGGENGIDPGRFSVVPVDIDKLIPIEHTPPRWAKDDCPNPATWQLFYEWATHFEDAMGPHGQMATPRVQVVNIGSRPHIFVARVNEAFLVPAKPDHSFGEPLVFPVQLSMAVAVGDVDGDGLEDLVLACQQETETSECSWVFWGTEGGFDQSQRTSLDTFRANDVAVADLSSNGCDDIIISQGFHMKSWTNDALVHGGNKERKLSDPIRLSAHNSMRVLVGKASDESDPVLAVANRMEGSLVGSDLPSYLYYGGPDGYSPDRMEELPSWGASDAIFCDFNDDGYADVALANSFESFYEHSKVYILLNGPNGLSEKPDIQLPIGSAGIACADLNRDGYLDLVTTTEHGTSINIFYGTKDGFDTENPTHIPMEHNGITFKNPRRPLLADFNNDGWLDLYVAVLGASEGSFASMGHADRSFILWGGPDGFSMDRYQIFSTLRSGGAEAADLTGNGYLDLIVRGSKSTPNNPNDSFLYIYWNGPEGLREDNRLLLPANYPLSMSIADFNNDGTLDIFVANYWSGNERDIPSYIFWNRKDRGFTVHDRTELPTHSAAGSIALDFNEDGLIDLAVANHKVYGSHVGFSGVWWNGPDGFSERNVTTLPSRGPSAMIWLNPGNVMDRSEVEYYTSCAHKLPDSAKVTGISWEAELQVKTFVKAQLRFAATEDELASAPWQGPDGEGSWFENDQASANLQQTGPWVQYLLALGAKNCCNTPRVTAVNVHYE